MKTIMEGKTLIIGKGEIGLALYRILEEYDVYIRDKKDLKLDGVSILHICFPYFNGFEKEVEKYKKQYKSKYVVIHSTVPIGTTRKCGAYNSPVMGVHPFLEEGMKVFVKYLAPQSEELKEYFNNAGINIMLIDEPENTEAIKLWETTQYGWFIILEKEIHKWCKKNGLDYSLIYTEANKNYNKGYEKLGMKNVNRPILRHSRGGIGGHCVMQNCDLINNKVAKTIKKFNKQYGV